MTAPGPVSKLTKKIKVILFFAFELILGIEGFSALNNRPPLEPGSDCSAVAVAKR